MRSVVCFIILEKGGLKQKYFYYKYTLNQITYKSINGQPREI